MDITTGLSLYPLHLCKTLHLVRHAQGVHNVASLKDHDLLMSAEYFDAQLSPLGWQQVENLRKDVHTCQLPKRIELVVVSPLLRTMQTAIGVFGNEGQTGGSNTSPQMVENVANSDHCAISSLNCPPFIAVELCRERLGVHPCDKRRTVKEYLSLFPSIDFSLIESEEDNLWKADTRESNQELAARGMKFMNWLWTREEKEIAIVTHSGFLLQTLEAFVNDSEISKHFDNCELRSVVIANKSNLGSDSSVTNYPGDIPVGLDLPSSDAKQKLTEKEMSK